MPKNIKITKNIAKKQSITTDRNKENCNEKPEVNKTPSSEEIGGRKGPEPTRFGDWEKNGRCIDF